MELKYDYLLYLHIAAGFIALAAGLAAAFFGKGSKRHTAAGRLFGFSMGLAALFAIALALWHPNPFLLGIGFFTLYLVSSGWVWIRRIPFISKVKIGKAIGIIGILSAGYMLSVGLRLSSGGVILYVFAGILTLFALSDLFVKTDPKKTAAKHGGRMGGALIAAITAFMATNVYFLPAMVVWLGPTIIGTPMIVLGIRKYYKKVKPKRKTS